VASERIHNRKFCAFFLSNLRVLDKFIIGDRAHCAQSFSLPQAEHLTASCRTPEAPQPAYRDGPHIGWGLDALAPEPHWLRR
jgi:hypothetical protein